MARLCGSVDVAQIRVDTASAVVYNVDIPHNAATEHEMTDLTPSQKLQVKMESLSLPRKSIRVIGASVIVTCHSPAAAEKWALLMTRFMTVRGIRETWEYASVNTQSNLCASKVKVWNVSGRC